MIRKFLPLLLILSACGPQPYRDFNNVPAETAAAGRKLAGLHCAGCHLVPEPDSLTRASWDAVLSHMSLHLGRELKPLDDDPELMGFLVKRREFLRMYGHLPARAYLSRDDLLLIRTWFLSQAPESFPREKASGESKLFIRDTRERFAGVSNRAISMLRTFPGKRTILIGGAWPPELLQIGFDAKLHSHLALQRGAPVEALLWREEFLVGNIGDLLGNDPGGSAAGEIFRFKNGGRTVLASGLPRLSSFDVRGDRLITSEFGGDGRGGSRLLQLPSGRRISVISPQPGAVKALFLGEKAALLQANDREGLYLHDLKGGNPQILLQATPETGFTFLVRTDLDGDGREELVALSGDNADGGPYSLIKPAHGIHIFRSDQSGNWERKNFIPLPGAYTAVARDFNGDGRIDLLVHSFFPDLRNDPPENLLLLVNRGTLQFEKLRVLPAIRGRISALAAADIDGDGDEDVLLGLTNLPYRQKEGTEILQAAFTEKKSVVLLLNTLR